jgi:hypothetical protein
MRIKMSFKRISGLFTIIVFCLILFSLTSACDISFRNEPAGNVPGDGAEVSPVDQPLEDQPAQLPPPPPPAAGQPPPQNVASPYTFNHLTPLLAEMFYGPCTSEETLVTIQTAFSPVENIDGVYLQYFYQWNEVTFSPYFTVHMTELGVGDWIGDIDAGLEAASTLGSASGQVYYFVVIQDINGNVAYSPGQWLNVRYCSPAAAEPPEPEQTAPPTVPADSGPTIVFFNYTNPATEGGTIHLEWSIENADCEVTLNGTPVNASGSQDDEVPLGNGGTSWYYILEAYGPPCDNPIYAYEEADVLIESVEGQILNQHSATLVTQDSIDFEEPSGPGDAVLMVHPEDNADGRPYLMQKSGTNTLLAGVSSQPSVADCISAIDQWSSITVWMDEGFFFCFQTDQGHYGYFYRSGMAFNENKSTWEVILEITTWENP